MHAFFSGCCDAVCICTLKQFCAQVCILDTGKRQTVEKLRDVCCKAVYPLLQILLYDNKAICIQVQPAVAWDDRWKYSKASPW